MDKPGTWLSAYLGVRGCISQEETLYCCLLRLHNSCPHTHQSAITLWPLTGNMSKLCSSCHTAMFCWENQRPGIRINVIMVVATYLRVLHTNHTLQHGQLNSPTVVLLPSRSAVGAAMIFFFRKSSKSTMYSLRCSFSVSKLSRYNSVGTHSKQPTGPKGSVGNNPVPDTPGHTHTLTHTLTHSHSHTHTHTQSLGWSELLWEHKADLINIKWVVIM